MISTAVKILDSTALSRLGGFGERVKKLNMNFAVYDPQGGKVLSCNSSNFALPPDKMANYCRQIASDEVESVQKFPNEAPIAVGIGLKAEGQIAAVAVIDLGEDYSGDRNRINYAEQMLACFAETFESTSRLEHQIEMVGGELAQTYEELMLLYQMSSNMKVTQSDANYLQMACDSLTDLVNVEGIAILLERKLGGTKQLVMTAGSGLIGIDRQMFDILITRLQEEIKSGREGLLDSNIYSPFKYDWFERIRNIVAVPLYSKGKIAGIMVATNRVGKADFDSIDLKLFNSVANECAIFIENGHLFRDLKELFIGSLRALTNSIDAKDQYTRGHSERVAIISRWLAEQVAETEPLDEDAINKIYLAGLLHDIGKIGINESLLRKQGPLTDSERKIIESHPNIGSSILGEIKQMQDVIPGVLCHHERMDGKGYPNKLCGTQIPLIGRIIMVADSFDAMTSRRTYRSALTLEVALAEIEKGLNTQFDEKVGRVFIESDVEQLWKVLQEGSTENFGQSNFLEYGALAVGALIQ